LHGLFKSTDGGATWTASNAGLPSDWILAIATDPQLPSTMYVVSGGRVFKSTDGGENWVAKGPPGTSTQAIALDPQTPTTIYAGGSKKSTDGGTTWTTIGSPGTVSTLVIDPQTPTTLYAVQKGGGVSKSTDGGVSWNPSSTGLSLKVLALAIDPQTPSTLYAGAFLSGVYKSIDGGANWVASSTGMPTPLSLEIVGVYALAINPQTPDTLYAGTARAGVFKSTDGGTNWTPINTGLINPGARVLAIDPQAPATLYAGTAYSGVFVRNPRFLGVCESAWSIKRFRCDFGNDNTFVLQQDGTPVCGSENCPGPPNACWSAPITQRTFESPGEISWTVGALGDLSVGQDRDVQAYGETFLLARSANSLTVPLAADVGRIWLNDADVTGSGPPGAVTLNLGTGWNHLEWTSYNQNRGTTFAMNFPFAQHVARMTSTPNSCGDGILEACEECDDGNTLDGDCCSSTCLIEPDGSLCDDDNICTQNGTCQEGACSGEPAQDGTVCNDDNACTTADQCVGGKCQGNPLTCGDGMVQESCGEECDDGIANGSNNCCSATCHVVDTDGDGVCDADDPCTGLTVVAKPTIVIGNLHTPPGDDTLSFKGQITLPAPFSPPIDPVTKGVRILIDDTQGTVLDATIPGGAFDLLTKTGWKVNKAGTTWTYRNGLGGILGIFRVTVKIVNETSGLIEFSVSGKNGSYPVPPANLPLRATLVIDAPLATTGQCGEARFPGPSPTPTCNFSVSGKTLTCK
jgi:cysteine-rich repeat protein